MKLRSLLVLKFIFRFFSFGYHLNAVKNEEPGVWNPLNFVSNPLCSLDTSMSICLFTLNYELLYLLNIQSIEITEAIDKIIGVVTKHITF